MPPGTPSIARLPRNSVGRSGNTATLYLAALPKTDAAAPRNDENHITFFTITPAAASHAADATALDWRQADDEVVVATRRGEFAGFVTLAGVRYEAHDRLARILGSFSDPFEARDALESHALDTDGILPSRALPECPPHSLHRPRRPRRGHAVRTRGPKQRKKDTDMATGTVKWFDSEKGFGFIAADDGSDDVFAHFSAITGGGYRSLTDGQKVEYDAERGPKGLQAANIRPL